MVGLLSTTSTMQNLMTNVTTMFTSVMTMMGDVVQTVTDNPLLLMYAILPLCGIGVGFFKRLAG